MTENHRYLVFETM